MRFVAVLTKVDELSSFLKEGMKELILPVFAYSRLPSLTKEEALSLSKECQNQGVRLLLEWDVLMTQEHLQKLIKETDQDFLNLFSAIRVQDLGALHFLKKNFPEKNVQLILEHGNHNFESLLSFSKVHPKLERMILSPQIPGSLLKDYAKRLPCPIEILYQGPLMLSYTPRHLLSRLGESYVRMRSLEGQAHELQAIDNMNGTLIIHGSRFSLERRKSELETWENCYFKVDQRLAQSDSPQTEGFYQKNQSSEVFVHLKNALIEREDGNYVGEVIDVVREHTIGISLAHPTRKLKKGDFLVFRTPEGRIKEQEVTQLWDFLMNPIEEGRQGEIVFIPHRGMVSVRSSVYYK